MLLRLPVFMLFVNSVIYASCGGIKTKTLTFVIDDTRSMDDDIRQVRKEVNDIMDMVLKKTSVIDDIVLITFNDPEVRLMEQTRNSSVFIRALNAIKVNNYNNYDCPEYSLSGIEKALHVSKPGSYIYVFTDASAKDYKKVNKIKNLCQKTQSKVVFVLTGNCHRPHSTRYKVYHDVAIASSGLVIEVNKDEVNLVVKTIGAFIDGNTNPVTSVEIEAGVTTHVPFTVDEKTEYIIVAATGKDIEMLVNSRDVDPEKIMWTRNSKIVQLIKPAPGNYTVDVRSKSTAHVAVYARTNFGFQHGFSEIKPKTIDDTTRTPIANTETRLSVLVEDPSDSVEIKSAQILNMFEEPIGDPLPLREIGDNLYITDSFISPESPFKLAVNGIFIDNGKSIRSLAKTPIYPQIVERAHNTRPTVTISEGDNITAILGNPLVLTCKVHAYPAPEIIWKDQHGTRIPTNRTTQEPPYDYISYLNLTSVTKTTKYYCKAINKIGKNEKSISIEIGDPFKVASHPAEKSRFKYGESASLKCDITADLKIKINWYYNDGHSTQKLRTSPNYNISSDGTELVIKSMKKDMVGKYICNAVLLSDLYIHKKFTTEVEIYGFDVPVISNLISFLNAQDTEPVTIPCLLTQGLPKPTIKWQFRTKGSFVDVDTTKEIQIVDDGLHIPHSQLVHNGEYKCIAENEAGNDEHVTTLTINKKPENKILEGTEIKVKYGGEAEIDCRTTGNPLPKIEWRDENGTILAPKYMDTLIRHQYHQSLILVLKNQKRSKKLYCYAENIHGKDVRAIDVIVNPPFKVINYSEGAFNVSYGEEATILCDLKSDLPMEINWYYTDEKAGVKTKISPSLKYQILLNGTVLKIHSMDVDLVGKYTCEASLLLDEQEKISFETELQIQGLKKPKVKQLSNVLKVMDNSSVVIECGILEGHPKPTITWQFQGRGSHVFIPMTETGEVLRIPNAGLDNSGNYRCVSENVLGRDMKTTELLVEKAPMVKIVEGNNITLPYGADLILTCEVVAYPPPKVVWTERRGIPVLTKTPSENINHVYKYAIKMSKMKKLDEFSCYASNNLGESIEYVDVNVETPFEVKEKPEANVNVDYGEAHTIKCHIKSPLNIKIQWYRIPEIKGMRRLIIPSDKVSISPDATELTIGFMEPKLDGAYGCTASLIDDDSERITYVTKIKTTGLASPEIDKSTTMIKVKSKSSATIPCRILKGNPKPDIEWYIINDPRNKPIYLNKTGEELQITEAILTNAISPRLDFLCIADNIQGHDQHQTEVIIEAPPRIQKINDKTKYTAIVGDVVLRIPCNATGYPKPTISWKANGLDITPDSKYSIVDGALIVRTPGENDTLEYICVAKNSLGEDSVTFDGIVTTGIYEYDKVYHINVLEGSSKKIICFHTGSDKLRWFLDEEPMNETESYIHLKDASESMDGNYSCRISNENGNRMITYVVEVGYPPSFKSYQVDQTWDWEGIGSLDCDINAKPNVTAQWFHEGEPIKTNGIILQLPITTWGHYMCKITNPHGSVSRSYEVTSSACLINRRKESVDTSPLLLSENLKWPQYTTNMDYLVIPHQEKLVLSCNSQDDLSNTFKVMPNKTKIEIICDTKDNYWIDGKIYKYSDLRCSHEVMPVVKRTGKQCLDGDTEMVQVGYQLDEFVTVYSVCLDTKNNVPMYSQVNMIETNDINIPTVSDWFKAPEMNLEKNDVYTCENSSHSCCIGKEQLVNVNDVNFGPAKRSTFIDDINSIPVWRNCNMSRMPWRRLEDRIREQYGSNSQFAVWTGASDWKGNVPQYLWKVVRFDESDSLAIIYVNDPDPKDSQVLCKNVCATEVESWVNSRDKYTYCCELTDFLMAFNIPEDAIGGL